MSAFKKLAHIIIGPLLSLVLLSCGGGGGGAFSSSGGGGHPSATVISGRVVDGFVAGATVTAYQVNADGTRGAQIGSPVTTDQFGNYTLNLGTYTGPVYLTSRGGTYTDAATGNTIDLTNSSLVLSAIVPNASGNVSAEINPLTSMAANVALPLAGQGSAVATAATGANALISNYFGLSSNILSTALLDLTKTNCMSGANQQSADVSAILAGISQLAKNYGVSPPDLIVALVNDVASDGLFDGLASGATISVVSSSGTGTIPLSTIEGPPPALTGLASAITTFMTTTASNVCGASVDPAVTSALSATNIFTMPAAPTGVQAKAQYGAAIISWNTVTLATSYNLYMATSTGVTPTSTQLPGYRVIPNVTSPSIISAGQTSATYYFVVTAVSGTTPYVGYESAPSAEVSTAVTANEQWAQTVTGGSSSSLFNGVSAASDGSGSVYAAGQIDGTGVYNFGNGVTATGTNSGGNIVLVKYNSSGVAQWARTATGGSDISLFNGVSTASDGSVYAAGQINGTGTYTFGPGVTATGTYSGGNIVLVKYNSSGTAQWARTVTGGSSSSLFNAVSTASDGSVYAAGQINGTGTYTFGSGVTAAGTVNGYNPVLVKYNSSGVAQWARTATGGLGDSYFNGVSTASDGSVYAAGYILGTGTYTFGNGVTATGTYSGGNIVLVKYDSLGAAQWARTVTGGGDSLFTSVSVASDGSVYAAGYIVGAGTYTFGTGVIAAGTNSSINMVLVKYDSTGAAQWAQTVAGGSSDSIFFSVSVASDGSVYAAGYIDGTGTYNLGNGVTAAGTYSGNNIVLVTYNSSGVAQWAQTIMAGSGSSDFNGVSVAPDGSVYAAGYITGTGAYNFGTITPITATGTYGGSNIVLVKYPGFGSITLSW